MKKISKTHKKSVKKNPKKRTHTAFAKKTKKSNDKSRCCGKCNFFDNRNKEDPVCSISGQSTKDDRVCPKIDTTVKIKCQRCGTEISYNNKNELYNNTHLIQMTSKNGTSSGQNIHLCKKCSLEVWEMFQDFIEKVKNNYMVDCE